MSAPNRAGHVAIIGFGAIAQSLVEILCASETARPVAVSVLTRPGRRDAVQGRLLDLAAGHCANLRVFDDLDALVAAAPDVIVECAGHQAVHEYAARILGQGIDLIVASVGALADPGLETAMRDAARIGGAQVCLPAGAIGGIDALGAARLSGLEQVTYSGRKPPTAWMGTPAEEVADLAALTEECVFFTGSARQAAQGYPKNANVAATLALAGLGMDATQVRLIADPNVTQNTHAFDVRAKAVDFQMTLVAKPSPMNPKTSASTVYSIARAVLNRAEAIVI